MDPVTEIITHSITVLFLEKTAVKVNPFGAVKIVPIPTMICCTTW